MVVKKKDKWLYIVLCELITIIHITLFYIEFVTFTYLYITEICSKSNFEKPW